VEKSPGFFVGYKKNLNSARKGKIFPPPKTPHPLHHNTPDAEGGENTQHPGHKPITPIPGPNKEGGKRDLLGEGCLRRRGPVYGSHSG